MKKVAIIALSALFIGASFTSCRDTEKSQKEEIIEEAQADGSEIEIKDGGDKVKIEKANGDEIKIKTDDGDVKIKTDDNS